MRRKNNFGEFLKNFADKFVTAQLGWWTKNFPIDDLEYSIYSYLAFVDLLQSLQDDLKIYGKYYFDKTSLPQKTLEEIENYKNLLIPKPEIFTHNLQKILQDTNLKYNFLEVKNLSKKPIKVLITGKFGLFREEIEKYLKTYNFVICQKMSSQVEAVIYGINYTRSKLDYALINDIPIFNFLELCQILTKIESATFLD